MGKTTAYDISKILKLVEAREGINLTLKTMEKPAIIIKDNNDYPLYKVCMTLFGDFMIYVNKDNSSIYKMLSKISNVDEFLYDGAETETVLTYVTASAIVGEETSTKANSTLRRGGIIHNSKKIESMIDWKLIFALPVGKSIELVDMLMKVFKDDICDNQKEAFTVFSEGKNDFLDMSE